MSAPIEGEILDGENVPCAHNVFAKGFQLECPAFVTFDFQSFGFTVLERLLKSNDQ